MLVQSPRERQYLDDQWSALHKRLRDVAPRERARQRLIVTTVRNGYAPSEGYDNHRRPPPHTTCWPVVTVVWTTRDPIGCCWVARDGSSDGTRRWERPRGIDHPPPPLGLRGDHGRGQAPTTATERHHRGLRVARSIDRACGQAVPDPPAPGGGRRSAPSLPRCCLACFPPETVIAVSPVRHLSEIGNHGGGDDPLTERVRQGALGMCPCRPGIRKSLPTPQIPSLLSSNCVVGLGWWLCVTTPPQTPVCTWRCGRGWRPPPSDW